MLEKDKWYDSDDHENLAELIRSLTSSYPGCAKIVVTYDACQETEGYYDFQYANIHHMTRAYSCNRK